MQIMQISSITMHDTKMYEAESDSIPVYVILKEMPFSSVVNIINSSHIGSYWFNTEYSI